MPMQAALLQMCSGDQPSDNLAQCCALLREAAGQGATLVLTPEVTNCVSASRAHQMDVLQPEEDDITLAELRAQAAELGIWLVIGSLALKTDDPDGRFANRSFVIGPDGAIRARYDKIHMFDVQISERETYRESQGFRPGDKGVIAPTPFATLGLSVCYDLRFAYLYRALAQAGAEVLTVPSAFSPVTGAAHWHALLRARAIETGCYVLAPAQSGTHAAQSGRPRRTYGHSLAVSPWGEVLLDMGEGLGVGIVSLDLEAVVNARTKLPSLFHDRPFDVPEMTR